MWKDWQELGLVIIIGMLLSGFVSNIDRTSSGSIFEGAKRTGLAQPAAARHAQPASKPAVLHYAGATNARSVTWVYGPAHSASIACGGAKRTLSWKRERRTVELPRGCKLIAGQTGVYSSSMAR
jgi:hypothetical protein